MIMNFEPLQTVCEKPYESQALQFDQLIEDFGIQFCKNLMMSYISNTLVLISDLEISAIKYAYVY